jgi:hypothetical protein
MGKAVPEQHPAVVLRSHYVHLRALLVAALIAVLGLTATVVIVANDSDELAKSTPAPAIEHGDPNEGSADLTPGVNLPARPTQAQAFPGQSGQARQAEAGVGRHDIRTDLRRLRAGGVTSQGSVGVTMSPPIGASSVMPQTRTRHDGGPNEGSADVTTGHFPCSALVAPQSDGSPCGGN